MPRFIVHFDRPVWYQPDHPQARKLLTELHVSGAPTAEKARIHAFRSVVGDCDVTRVEQVETFPSPPPIDDIVDGPPITIDATNAALGG